MNLSLSLQHLLPSPGSKVLPFDRGVRQRPQTPLGMILGASEGD